MNYRENDKFIDGFPRTCHFNGFSVFEWRHAWQIDLKSMADCLVANSVSLPQFYHKQTEKYKKKREEIRSYIKISKQKKR